MTTIYERLHHVHSFSITPGEVVFWSRMKPLQGLIGDAVAYAGVHDVTELVPAAPLDAGV